MRIASWNICSGVAQPYAQAEAYDPVSYISEIITREEIELIFFQETLTRASSGISFSREISNNTSLKHFCELELSDSHMVNGSRMGISIMSRFPVNVIDTIKLENPCITVVSKSGKVYDSHDKGFLIGMLEIEPPCYIVTGHCLPFHTFSRDATDFKYIYEPLEDRLIALLSENCPVIIGGDFNTTRLRLVMPKLFESYESLFEQPTRISNRQDDYIFINRLARCSKVTVKPTLYDHHICIADIVLEK